MAAALERARRAAARAVPLALIIVACAMMLVAIALLAQDAVAQITLDRGAASDAAAGRVDVGALGLRRGEAASVERVRLEADLADPDPALETAVAASSVGGGYALGGRLMLEVETRPAATP